MGFLKEHTFSEGRIQVHAAWTREEIFAAVEEGLDAFAHRLPLEPDARILLKPNLNNDLVALVGNSTDLRVLAALIEGLQNRGYTEVVLADGANVGVDRRGIDGFARLRVDRLAERYGIGLLNLNETEGLPLPLEAGALPQVSKDVLEADCLISVPTVKTHAEMVLSCAMKNWVGIVRGQDKRQVHYALAANIHALNEAVVPDLVFVDGVIGMEGNGPGDGDPFRLGRVLVSDSVAITDLTVCRMLGLDPAGVPALACALEAGSVSPELVAAVAVAVAKVHDVRLPPKRSRLARLAEAPSLRRLKKAVQPLLLEGPILKSAYRFGVVQDVYSLEDDTVTGVSRAQEDCGTCNACADVCPTGLKVEEIGIKTEMPDCIGCLYCWWVCPDDTISLVGEPGHLTRQIERYREAVRGL